MANLKINGVDFSGMVNGLTVESAHNYNAETNAAGDTVVDYINSKVKVRAGFRALTADEMAALQLLLARFTVSVYYRNPATNTARTISAIAPEVKADYYTTAGGRVLFNEFTVEFIEL